MKAGFIFSEAFWGVVLILLGVSAILKSVFHINLPLLRIALSFFLIYIGVSLLLNGFHIKTDKNTVLFDHQRIEVSPLFAEYNIIFGSGRVDLGKSSPGQSPGKKEVNIIFSRGEIRVDPELPVKIEIEAAFAGVQLPDGNSLAFGDYTYLSRSYREGEGHILLQVSVVFGALEVIEE